MHRIVNEYILEKRQYRQAYRFYKEAERRKHQEQKSIIEKADHCMTTSAYILKRYQGMKTHVDVGGNYHLSKALDLLYEYGVKRFEQANEYIDQMTEEEKIEFWKIQKRNRQARRFEELITKTDEFRQLTSVRRNPIRKCRYTKNYKST